MTKLEARNSKLDWSPAGSKPVRDFTDLHVWQLAVELRNEVYRHSKAFPADEKYALAQQLRRAVTSITANIAEGFGRYSYQENIQFCRHARGSGYEVRDHSITARDQGYISDKSHQPLDLFAQRVIQTLNGYIRSTQARRKAAIGPKSSA
jgi:four helix bundle protein